MNCLFSTVSFAQTQSVSQHDALAIAQRQFAGKDVDYYILSNSSSTVWNIFVDAEPMKGWQHDCYILTIPKSTTSNISAIVPKKEFRKMPPSEDYAPLSVKNRYGVNANSKPQVRKVSSTNGVNDAAQRTYAIILSGGVNKNSNQIPAKANMATLDGSNLSQGIYVICYTVNSAVVDQQKVRIE